MDRQLLGAWWPEASRRVTAELRRKGVSEQDAADALQETAAKALTAELDVADVDEFCRWAYTVAWRKCIDGYRRSRRASGLAPPDQADAEDVAASVEGRIDVQRTLAAMASLSPTDRAALAATLSPVERALSRKESVRDAVRLFRARARLLAMVGKLGAAAAAAWRVLRKALMLEPAAKAVATAGLVVLAILTLDLPGPDVHSREVPTAPADQPAPTAVLTPAVAVRPAAPSVGPATPAATLPAPAPPPPATSGRKYMPTDKVWDPHDDEEGLLESIVTGTHVNTSTTSRIPLALVR